MNSSSFDELIMSFGNGAVFVIQNGPLKNLFEDFSNSFSKTHFKIVLWYRNIDLLLPQNVVMPVHAKDFPFLQVILTL